jgi:hypothetical protein
MQHGVSRHVRLSRWVKPVPRLAKKVGVKVVFNEYEYILFFSSWFILLNMFCSVVINTFLVFEVANQNLAVNYIYSSGDC